jgi:hypothetical protein
MNTWVIVAIGAAVIIVGYFLLRKKTILPAAAVAPSSTVSTTAPGVDAQSGQTYTASPAPPRDGVLASYQPYTPKGVLQHVPIIGGAASAITHTVVNAPIKIGLGVANKVNSALEHIPVAGKLLSAPGKVAGKIGSSISHVFSSIF